MSKRLYEPNGMLTEEGRSLFHLIEYKVKDIIEEANDQGIDLRDLQCVLHDTIDTPIAVRLIKNRKAEEDGHQEKKEGQEGKGS